MKKTVLSLGALMLILGTAGLLTDTAFAYRGDPTVEGPDCSPERHQEMTEAFESGDYDAWKNLMEGKGRVVQVVNEDNFARFAEAHQLALQGDTDGAREIRQELGLGLRNGSGEGKGMGRNR